MPVMKRTPRHHRHDPVRRAPRAGRRPPAKALRDRQTPPCRASRPAPPTRGLAVSRTTGFPGPGWPGQETPYLVPRRGNDRRLHGRARQALEPADHLLQTPTSAGRPVARITVLRAFRAARGKQLSASSSAARAEVVNLQALLRPDGRSFALSKSIGGLQGRTSSALTVPTWGRRCFALGLDKRHQRGAPSRPKAVARTTRRSSSSPQQRVDPDGAVRRASTRTGAYGRTARRLISTP